MPSAGSAEEPPPPASSKAWKLKVTVQPGNLAALKIPILSTATVGDLEAEVLRRLTKPGGKRAGLPTTIVGLADPDGFDLDPDDLVGAVLESDSLVVATFSAEPGQEQEEEEQQQQAEAVPEGQAAPAAPVEPTAGDSVPKSGDDPAATTTIAFHTISSCRQEEPEGQVKINLATETLGGLKRKICLATGVQYEEQAAASGDPASGSGSGSDSEDEPEHDDHSCGAGACLCKAAFATHGEPPKTLSADGSALFCQPCDAVKKGAPNEPTECLICRTSLRMQPPGFQDDSVDDDEDEDEDSSAEGSSSTSPAVLVSVGTCGCVFHTACVTGWLQGGQSAAARERSRRLPSMN
eukprot:SAG22_NODE_3826_length_1513_cov_1.523338_1_plen_350_part_10